jgi:ATP-dependent Clp protease adapter protein ClpS
MTENEMELLRIIREADDPTKVAEVMMDILTRCPAVWRERAWRISLQAMG